MAKTKMTENARKVFDYLKDAGVGASFTYKGVAEALGFDKTAAVVGTVSSLYKKGYVEKFTEDVEDAEGKVTTVKKFALTESGANYDPDAEVDE